jgi:exodeoxyribonuclease VII large subunit
VDVTIADYAADLRAATPSAAGELVVPARADLQQHLRVISDTLGKFVDSIALNAREQLSTVVKDRAFRRPMENVQRRSQRLDDCYEALNRSVAHSMGTVSNALEILRHQVMAHDPKRIQRKGYAIIRKGDRILRSVSALQEKDHVDLQFHDGNAAAVIESIQ